MALTANFEKGVNGNDISNTDPASDTPWFSVEGTPRPKYDNTHVAHGNLSAKIGGNAAPDSGLIWNLSNVTNHYGRLYFYATANPPNQQNLAKWIQSGITRAFLAINSTGKVVIQDTAGGHNQASAISIALNMWIRLEWHYIHSVTVGQLEAKLFNSAESISPTETITGPASWDTGSSIDTVNFTDRDGI